MKNEEKNSSGEKNGAKTPADGGATKPAAGESALKKFCPVTAFRKLDAGKKKKVVIAGGAAGAALLAGLIALLVLSWSPGIKVKDATTAKLTPAVNCGLFVSAPNLGKNLKYAAAKEPVASLMRKEVPGEFWKLSAGPEVERLNKKFHINITPRRLIAMAASDVSYARYPNASKENPTDFIIISRLGFMQRVMANMGRKKLGEGKDMQGYNVQEFGSTPGTKHYVTMAGGFLIVTDSKLLMEQALSIGAGKIKGGVANDRVYELARKHRPGGRAIMEWYSPGGNIKSSLTNAKINYGCIEIGGGGATVYFASEPHSKAAPGKPRMSPNDNPAYLIPNTASVFTITHSFGRIWQDLLLGKSMTAEEADTFMKDLYGLGVDKLGEYFDGKVSVSLDGIMKTGDGTPVPNLIFAYKVKDGKKALAAADAIFKKTIKENYSRTPDKYRGAEFVRYSSDSDDAVISISYGVIDGKFLVVTLTSDEMKKVIDAARNAVPGLTSLESYKKYYSDKTAEQDMFILVNGDRLAADSTGFFSAFSGISSRPLSEAINRLIIPAFGTLNYSGAGAGGVNYEDGLLIGSLRLDSKVTKPDTKKAAEKKRKRALL